MKVEVMTITPPLAREWMERNIGNRHMRAAVVERYARDMEADAWQLNGETIVLNGDRILDGQHRLRACIQSGRSFQSVVVTDADSDVMRTIDQGLSRNSADVLRWRGYTLDPNNLAAAVSLTMRWDQGILLRGGMIPTAREVEQYLDAHPELDAAVRGVRHMRTAPLRLRPSIAASVYAKAMRSSPEDAGEFFGRLWDGEELKRGDAILALRRLLISNAARVGYRMNQNHLLAVTVKAWNDWVTGEPLEVLGWRAGGRNPEAFPVMVDATGRPLSAEQ